MEREFGKEWKQRIGEVGRPAIVRAGSTPKLSTPGPGQVISRGMNESRELIRDLRMELEMEREFGAHWRLRIGAVIDRGLTRLHKAADAMGR